LDFFQSSPHYAKMSLISLCENRVQMLKTLSISTIIRLILLTGLLSLFFACSSAPKSFEGVGVLKDIPINKEAVKDAIENEWSIPEQYKNISVEQIKAQIEITDYMVIKGAATRAEKDMIDDKKSPKMKADIEALASYANKLISLEGVVNIGGGQKSSPLDIKETQPGKYEIWFCADKNQQRKPCRYRAFLLYEGPEGKGDTLFTHDNVIRFWGVMLGEEIGRLSTGNLAGYSYKRYPKVRVLDLEIIK